jgi:hypothetical protein
MPRMWFAGLGALVDQSQTHLGHRPADSMALTHQPVRRRCRVVCREPYHGASRNCSSMRRINRSVVARMLMEVSHPGSEWLDRQDLSYGPLRE